MAPVRLKYAPAGGLSQCLGDRGDLQVVTVIDTVPDEPGFLLIATWSAQPTQPTRVLKMNALTGGPTTVASAPLRRSDFTLNARGLVRFAYGSARFTCTTGCACGS